MQTLPGSIIRTAGLGVWLVPGMRPRWPVGFQVNCFSKIVFPRFWMLQDFVGSTLTKDLSSTDHITAIGDCQCFPDLVIRDQYRDPVVAKLADDDLNTVNSHRINTPGGARRQTMTMPWTYEGALC